MHTDKVFIDWLKLYGRKVICMKRSSLLLVTFTSFVPEKDVIEMTQIFELKALVYRISFITPCSVEKAFNNFYHYRLMRLSKESFIAFKAFKTLLEKIHLLRKDHNNHNVKSLLWLTNFQP